MTTSHPLSRRRAIKTLFFSSAALSFRSTPLLGATVDTAKTSLHLLAIGDFGTGSTDQRKVAEAMQNFVKKHSMQPDALLFIGDNFYGPTKNGFTIDSPRWQTDIEAMYPNSLFPGPCYPVLGNHDYHDNPGGEQTQLAYHKQSGVRWHLPAKWYRTDLGSPQPLVTLIALDSNLPAVSGKGTDKKTGKPRASLTADEAAAQLEWLKQELAKPRAPFTLVMGHHPLYSNGSHGDTPALISDWEPLFQQHNVHAYLCGHDHDLQHLEMEDRFTSHILSGGGGARTRALDTPERTMPYGDDIHGFTHIQVQPETLTFAHYNAEGSLVHRFTKLTDGQVKIG